MYDSCHRSSTEFLQTQPASINNCYVARKKGGKRGGRKVLYGQVYNPVSGDRMGARQSYVEVFEVVIFDGENMSAHDFAEDTELTNHGLVYSEETRDCRLHRPGSGVLREAPTSVSEMGNVAKVLLLSLSQAC